MKRVLAGVAALALTITVAAPATAAVTTKLNKNDRLYVSILRSEVSELRYVSPAQLVKGAKITCKGLRSGMTLLDVVEIAVDNGLSENTAMALVAGAVVFYCPEQEDNF